jgi:hypothetical protein
MTEPIEQPVHFEQSVRKQPKKVNLSHLILGVALALTAPGTIESKIASVWKAVTSPEPLPNVATLPALEPTPLPPTNVVKWLESPLTRRWTFNSSRSVWESEKLDQAVTSQPSIIIGLRADGTVIWKEKPQP